MLTIKAKIIIAYMLVFGMLLCVFAYLIYESSRRAEIAKMDTRLESHADKLKTEIEEQSDEKRFPQAGEFGDIVTDGLPGVLFEVRDSVGEAVLKDSLLSTKPITFVTPTLMPRKKLSRINMNGERYRVLATPVEVDDRYLYSLLVAAPMTEAARNLTHLRLLFLISIPSALVLASIAAYLITHSAFRPIATMVATARQISASNLDQRLLVPAANDEIRQLAETLNGMIERIDSAFSAQKQFIADASHELRTPLTIIYSELEFAKRRVDDEETNESLQNSLSEIDRLARMSESLLLLARLDSSASLMTFSPVRLDELLLECVQLVNKIAEQKGIQIKVHVDEAVEIQGDSERLKGALLNLLDNAVKYSQVGGEVGASLSILTSPSRVAQIIVADNGPGISPGDLPHVFERFYRASSNRGESSGSGLGLAIAQRIISLHDGSLVVGSKLGKGTVFTLTLPVS
ncbi:MAG: ATP-binding protein [candidate division Zixibacteria bacterium]|nr:ATP-binding protein [candidate division Zixibacteria bacterium]